MATKILRSSGFLSLLAILMVAAASILLLRYREVKKQNVVEMLPANDAGVRQLVARTFGSSVALAGDAPQYVSGDFNGDGSEDVAVLVRPAGGKLEEINGADANWIIRDPHKVFLPAPGQRVITLEAHPKPETVEANDVLIAMIHGVGPEGWRGQQTQQIFLLRNVAESSPVTEHPAQLPWQPQKAAVLRETSQHAPGYIYWVGTMYAWHSLADNVAKK
jgi:hypothetical protein